MHLFFFFIKSGIDFRDVEAMGITKLGEKKGLLIAIQKLRDKNAGQPQQNFEKTSQKNLSELFWFLNSIL